MKILKLKLKNINSLAGENEIDFTNPVFTREGLFAITGKTGAGKTSILDAISLAFYGKPARLGPTTVGENDIMTRGETDCYAEVTFEVAGKQWKSSWKQALNKNGNLRPVERHIADHTDRIVADRITSCNAQIVEILGLTFEQFTKVILRAQGSFAAFLNADKNKKGTLLEQITGTAIYAEISGKVFEQNRLEKEKPDRILIELSAISILSEAQISQLKEEIAALEIERDQANAHLYNLEAAQRWLAEIADLEKRIHQAKESLPVLEEQVASALGEYVHTENTLNRITEERAKLEPVFNQVRELDSESSEKTKLLARIRAEIGQIQKAIEHAGKALAENKTTLENFQASLREKQQWANDNAKYEQLVTDFSTIEERHQFLLKARTNMEQIAARIDALYAQLIITKTSQESANKSFTEAQEKVNTQSNALKSKRAQLAEILDGREVIHLYDEKEKLNALQLRINRLIEIENVLSGNHNKSEKKNADENKNLEEKSVSDNLITRTKIITELQALDPDFFLPTAEDKMEVLTRTQQLNAGKLASLEELITTAMAINVEILDLQEIEIPAAQQELRSAEKLKYNIARKLKSIEAAMKEKRDLSNGSFTLLNMEKRKFIGWLKYYAVEDIHGLRNCLDAWNDNAAQISRLTNQLNSLTLEISTKDVEFINLKQSLDDRKSAAITFEKEIQQLDVERRAIFSGTSVVEEETRSRNLQERATAERDTALAALNRAKTALESQKAVIQTQEKGLGDTLQLRVTDKTMEEIHSEIREVKDIVQHIAQQIGPKHRN